jgi:hypothetical protein
VRGKRKNTRALAHLAGLGLRAKSAGVNGSPKFSPILAGTQLSFADLFYHFESVTDFTREILEICNRLGFWDAKNPSSSFL